MIGRMLWNLAPAQERPQFSVVREHQGNALARVPVEACGFGFLPVDDVEQLDR